MRAAPHLASLAAFGCAAAALCGHPAAAQDTCEMSFQAAVGERRLITVETTVDATVTATDLEQKVSARSVFSRRKETFAEETVVVDDRKMPIQVRLNCLTSSVEERTAGDTSGGLRKSSLQGRIVTVTREGAGWSTIPMGGDPLGEDVAASLGRWLDLPLLLKRGPVKVGDSWEVTGADRLVAFGIGKESGTPEIRCTLGRIVSGTPARAEVAVSIRLSQGEEGTKPFLGGQLAGLLVMDLSAGKPLSLSLSGSFRAAHDARDANDAVIGAIDIQARQIQLRMTFEPVAAK